MNAKFLYATTVALALASSLAFAQESRPLTRAEVNKAWAEAAADGTLRKNDYDYDANDFKARSTVRTKRVAAAELSQQECRSPEMSTTGMSGIAASSTSRLGSSGQSPSRYPTPTSTSPAGGRGAAAARAAASAAEVADETSTRWRLIAHCEKCTC